MHSNFACLCCKKPMNAASFRHSQYCQAADCQRQKVTDEIKRIKGLTAELTAKVKARCDEVELTEDQGANLASVVTIVPANQTSLAPLTAQRKQAFIEKLTELYLAVKNNIKLENHVYSELPPEKLPNNDYAPWLIKGCATCRGHCCLDGGTHAFQDVASVSVYLAAQESELSIEELIAKYQTYFPRETSEKGCVYQGRKGCTLPKGMRSLTCNRYLCKPLSGLQNQLKNDDKVKVYFVANQDYKIIRLNITNKNHSVDL